MNTSIGFSIADEDNNPSTMAPQALSGMRMHTGAEVESMI